MLSRINKRDRVAHEAGILSFVIPGTAEGRNPESSTGFGICIWIPGSHASRAPRNDSVAAGGIMSSLYAGRRRKNSITMALSLAATAFRAWLAGADPGRTAVRRLQRACRSRFFTEMTPPPGSTGGLLNAIMGSLVLTGLAVLIGHAHRYPGRHLHGGIRPPRSP